MSTTFGIIPTKLDDQLTFGNVVSIAEKTLSDFLQAYQMDIKIKISVDIRDNDEKYINPVNLDDRFFWKNGEYAYFTLDKAKGGTDAYCNKISDTLEYWETYIEETCGKLVTPAQVKQIKEDNVKWYFRRSAGQSALINIAYGHLAAATAKLCNGIIHSETGWDPELFPTTADEFIAVYFKPEKATHEASRKWAEKSLNNLRESAVGKKTTV